MGLEYIQLFADMEELFEPFDDAQRGRLMTAMMAYAYRGEEPQFEGVEKFGWPAFKQHINRCAASVEAKKAAGSKGGRHKGEDKQTQAEESESKQSEAETSRAKQTQADASKEKQNAHNHEQEHEQEQEYDHEQKKNNGACARGEAAPAAAADEQVIGIDGTDLSGAMADYDRAGELVSRFKLPDNDISRGAIIEDAGRVGWERVEKALTEAANANSRPMLSVNFYRAVLKNEGKPREAGGGRDIMQRHSYTQTDYNRMIIDLDAEDTGPKGKDGDRMLRHTLRERKATYSAAIVDFDGE